MASPVWDPWAPPPLTVGEGEEYVVVGMVVPGRNVDMGGRPRLSCCEGGTVG